MHGPAGTGKSELLKQWAARQSDRRILYFAAPPPSHELSALIPREQISSGAGRAPLSVIIDDIDSALPADLECLLFTALRSDSTMRIIVAGRAAESLEKRAQHNHIRTTIRFGDDLRATTTDVAAMAEARGQPVDHRRIGELVNLTNGWLEPVRMILDESSPSELNLSTAKRWLENVAFDSLSDNDLALLERLSLLTSITVNTMFIAANALPSDAPPSDRLALLHEHGLVMRTGTTNWSLVPLVKSVIGERISAMSAPENREMHAKIAAGAYASGPRRFAPEVLRHAHRGHSWKLLEQFWSDHGEAAIEHPHEASAAYSAVPDAVVNHSTTLTVAAALTADSSAEATILERLSQFSVQHRTLQNRHSVRSIDEFVEAAVIRILQLRHVGRLTEADTLGDQTQHDLRSRMAAGSGAPTAINSALLLIQNAATRMLSHNDHAAAAELARHALEFARSSKLSSLETEILGYVDVIRAANGWLSQSQPTPIPSGTSVSTKSHAEPARHNVALAMSAVDSLDRDWSETALDNAHRHSSDREIWPLAALAESRHALFFETSDTLDDRYRHMTWSHPYAGEESRTGRMILEWSGVLADLRAGRLEHAAHRISESSEHSGWLSVLIARLHLSRREYESVLTTTDSATTSEDMGNRERAQFLFMSAASSLALGDEQKAVALFRGARSIADTHGLRSTYLAISRDHRDGLLSLTHDRLPRNIAERLDDLPDAFPERPSPPVLSARETQMLHGIATGASHREIASSLYISLATVRSHVRTLYAKLDVRDRVAAVSRAQTQGLLIQASDASIPIRGLILDDDEPRRLLGRRSGGSTPE
ncbi:LuxR C-terminal-related transcriptional regulator [Paramicrobacterium fandaimingii]|uniref:LuxR C-terminal-related transcriptional regulator n=1 Tax=Paramicrobacterium fandaimingii TaxID=2708079 RepID=UPI001420F490|nr:LuxR C-terminal-related transcriptional regulator [Microbacterium fandaimingii]